MKDKTSYVTYLIEFTGVSDTVIYRGQYTTEYFFNTASFFYKNENEKYFEGKTHIYFQSIMYDEDDKILGGITIDKDSVFTCYDRVILRIRRSEERRVGKQCRL